MVESEWNKDPEREELVLFIGYLSLKEKTWKRPNEQIRNQHFPSKVSRFEVNYYVFYWILLLSTSLSTFTLDLDFWSSESFCYKSPKVQTRNGVFYLPNQQEPFTEENLCVYTIWTISFKGWFIKWSDWWQVDLVVWEWPDRDGGKFQRRRNVWQMDLVI